MTTSLKPELRHLANGEPFPHQDVLPVFQNNAIQQSDERCLKPQSGGGYKLKIAKAGYTKGTWSSAQSIGQDPQN